MDNWDHIMLLFEMIPEIGNTRLEFILRPYASLHKPATSLIMCPSKSLTPIS